MVTAALVGTAALAFYAGMRVERVRARLDTGMRAELDDIDRERDEG